MWDCCGFCWLRWVVVGDLNLINRRGLKTHDECRGQNVFILGGWVNPESRID
jgi:hypothetical protein